MRQDRATLPVRTLARMMRTRRNESAFCWRSRGVLPKDG